MGIRQYPEHTNPSDINLALANLGFDSEAVISILINADGIDADIAVYDRQGNQVIAYMDGDPQPVTYSVFIPHTAVKQVNPDA